ncbi:hypothetical protein JCM30237_04470 [Halolamina litorea]|uniref:Uncharacterized protein n=1 Tax=Halolamina litorea TaxID=1515593 RepID=A0ABD6BP44_9EURY|nr:hypothetical protein [Halolamina litorea]
MVHPRLLVLAAGLVLLIPLAELWSRYWNADPGNWPRRALVRGAAACAILALLGFDNTFGLVPDPGVGTGVAFAAELTLISLSLAGYAAFFWLLRRD